MKKVFLSQPMRGKTNEEIKCEREEIVKEIKSILGEEIEIMDTVFDDFDGATPLKYLAKSIMVLADADVAVFSKGWNETRGCSIEFQCATAYGIPVMIL